MQIVLDTNIIVRRYHLNTVAYRILFDALKKPGYTLHIPSIVIEEAAKHYAEDLRQQHQVIRKALREVKSWTGVTYPDPLDQVLDDAQSAYSDTLRRRFTELGAIIVGYPAASHQSIAERALTRRKPFKANGAGYQDTLIWETVLEVAEEYDDPIAFITNNSTDFLGKDNALHSELIEDLEEREIGSSRVSVFRSLEMFNEEHAQLSLKFVADVKTQLQSNAYEGLDLEEAIPIASNERAYQIEVDSRDIGFPQEYENITIAQMMSISSIAVLDVRELSEHELLVSVEADAECEFDFYIYKADLFALDEEEEDLFIDDFDWSDHYASASQSKNVHVTLDLTTDIYSKAITGFQLKDLSVG